MKVQKLNMLTAMKVSAELEKMICSLDFSLMHYTILLPTTPLEGPLAPN